MNNPPTIQEVEERFDSLPEDIKRALDGIDTTNTIANIGNRHRLHFDQIQSLAASIGYLMLGFVKPQNFIDDLTNSARIPPSLATEIAKDVNEQLLRPIKGRLKEVHEHLENRPKGINPNDSSAGIFEQKIKSLFGPEAKSSAPEIRPTIKPQTSTDPYREIPD